MDWIFGLGYGQLKEKNNKSEVLTAGIDKVDSVESHSGIMWEAGMMFYLNQNFNIRTDLTALHYSAQNIKTTGSSLKSNFDATVSLGCSF